MFEQKKTYTRRAGVGKQPPQEHNKGLAIEKGTRATTNIHPASAYQPLLRQNIFFSMLVLRTSNGQYRKGNHPQTRRKKGTAAAGRMDVWDTYPCFLHKTIGIALFF